MFEIHNRDGSVVYWRSWSAAEVARGAGWTLTNAENTRRGQRLSYNRGMRGVCARFLSDGAFFYATTRRGGLATTAYLGTAMEWLQ